MTICITAVKIIDFLFLSNYIIIHVNNDLGILYADNDEMSLSFCAIVPSDASRSTFESIVLPCSPLAEK